MVYTGPDGAIRTLSNPTWNGSFSSAANGGVEARLQQRLGLKGAADASVTISRTIPAAGVGRVGAMLAKSVGPAAIAITLAPLIWDEVERRFFTPEPGTGFEYLDGYLWAWGTHQGEVLTAPEVLARAELAAQGGGRWDIQVTSVSQPDGQGMAYVNVSYVTGFGPGSTAFQIYRQTPVVPEMQLATDQQIADVIVAQGVQLDAMSDIARQIAQSAFGDQLASEAGPIVTTGPATIPGPTSIQTSSGPSGVTTTTTTTNYDVTYNSNVINVTSTTTTTTVAPDGTTTTTTETAATEEVLAQDEPKPFCELYPKASACAELGKTDDEELDEEERTLEFSWNSASGSCPAPRSMNLGGTMQEFSFQPMCNFFSALRPLVIAVSLLMAGVFLVQVGRQQ